MGSPDSFWAPAAWPGERIAAGAPGLAASACGITGALLAVSATIPIRVDLPWSVPGGALRGSSRRHFRPVPRSRSSSSRRSARSTGSEYWRQTDHPRERPQAAAVLRADDRRHGAARRGAQLHALPGGLGGHGAGRVLLTSRPRTTCRRCARSATSTSSPRGWARCACSPCSPCCTRPRERFDFAAPPDQRRGCRQPIFLWRWSDSGSRPASCRCTSGCPARTPRRPATCRPSCRAC